MDSERSQRVQVLLDHPGGAGMVVSCYADTSVTEGFESHWLQHLKAEATHVRARLAGDAEALGEFERHLESIRSELESPEARRARGMAVFAATGWERPLALHFDQPFEDRLVVDEEPYLVPFLLADEALREYLVVLADTHRARLYAADSGSQRLIDVIEEARPKGDRSVRERHEEHILRFEKELARRLGAAWAEHPYRGIVLLGEQEVLKAVRDLLAPRLAGRVVHEAPHAWSGEAPSISEEVCGVVTSAAELRRDRLLDELAGRLREGCAVATGPQEVIDALRDGQATAVVLGPDPGEVGSRCTGCRALFAAEESPCPYCQSPCARTSLWQEIVTRAMRHGVEVAFVRSDPQRAVPGGVAALLARDDPQWTHSRRLRGGEPPGPTERAPCLEPISRRVTMSTFRTILFAADFSPASQAAFHVACALADPGGGRLLVLHVVGQTPVVEQDVAFGEQGMLIPLPVDGTHREALRERLRALYAPDRPLEIEYRVAEGITAEEILRAAGETGADLIALGTHGRTGLGRLLTGSVAEAVLRRATCPVLALRTPEGPARQTRVILHPADFSAAARTALGVARTLARDLGARLVVLHVAPIQVLPGEGIVLPFDPRPVQAELELIRDRLDGPDLKYPVETRWRQGDAAPQILQAAEEAGADLIVLGTHGRTGLSRLLVGSVTEAVLRGSRCPVLAVKTPARAAAAAPPPRETMSVTG
jgi:nucleotide-binding universal stress UspA family protein